MQKFKNKYRIPSARLATWDYSWPGSYFITICTKNRNHYFGEIRNGEMYLNEIGIIADQCWAEIPGHFNNITLGEFVIMPNHTHGIINIERSSFAVETGHALSLPQTIQNNNHHFRFRNPGKNTISSMVGSFKSAVSRLAHPINKNFGWQTRFHDHIIHSHADYLRISDYILNNPVKWIEDRFNR
jgi:REP element-mobilizing transposase RayT